MQYILDAAKSESNDSIGERRLERIVVKKVRYRRD